MERTQTESYGPVDVRRSKLVEGTTWLRRRGLTNLTNTAGKRTRTYPKGEKVVLTYASPEIRSNGDLAVLPIAYQYVEKTPRMKHQTTAQRFLTQWHREDEVPAVAKQVPRSIAASISRPQRAGIAQQLAELSENVHVMKGALAELLLIGRAGEAQLDELLGIWRGTAPSVVSAEAKPGNGSVS